MTKCLICNKGLTNGVASAKKSNGDYYLLCSNCGNVHYVKVLNNGLTEIQRTSNEYSEETKEQILEAINLFGDVGVNVMNYKIGIHSDKKSVKELKENTLTNQEETLLKESYSRMPLEIKKEKSYEDYKEEFLRFKKAMEEKPEETIKSTLNKLASALFDNNYEDDEENECSDHDCDFCDEEKCSYHPNYRNCFNDNCSECDNEDCLDYPEFEEDDDFEDISTEEALRQALPKYIIEGTNHKGKSVITDACTKEELEEIFNDAENEGVTITKVSKVNISLSPVEVKKTYKYSIK